MEPKEFFRRLLEKKQINANSLADLLGSEGASGAQSTFQRFLAGRTAQPRHSTMKGVADLLEVNVQAFYDTDVAEDEAQRLGLSDLIQRAGEESATNQVQKQASELPSIDRIEGALRVLSEAGKHGSSFTVLPVVDFQGMDMSHKNDLLAGKVDQWLTAPGRYSPFSKITPMPDDSMQPEIFQGDYVAFEDVGAVKLRAGDTVVVGDKGGRMWFRKFRPQIEGGFHAVATNADHPTLKSEEHDVSVLAVMVCHWRVRQP